MHTLSKPTEQNSLSHINHSDIQVTWAEELSGTLPVDVHTAAIQTCLCLSDWLSVWEATTVLPYMAGWGSTSCPTLFFSRLLLSHRAMVPVQRGTECYPPSSNNPTYLMERAGRDSCACSIMHRPGQTGFVNGESTETIWHNFLFKVNNWLG